MSPSRRDAAFLRALSQSKLEALAWPEGLLAVIIGIGGGIGMHHYVALDSRLGVVGDSLVLVGTLLGVVFAAFALLIALFSDEYVTLLDKAEGGIVVFLRPFILAIGLQVTTLLLAISYRGIARQVPATAEYTMFLIWAFLFVYVMTDVVALTRNVTMHGLARAEQINKRPSGDQPTIHQLWDRSS